MKAYTRLSTKIHANTLRDIVEMRACLKFNPKDTVPDIIERMRVAGSAAGAVVDSAGQFAGFITKDEIVHRIFGRFEPHHGVDNIHEQKAISRMTAWDVMISNPDTLHVDDTIEDALDLITYFGYSAMPVVGAQRNLIGIVEAEELQRHVKTKSRILREKNVFLPSHVIQQDLGIPHTGLAESC